MKHSPVERVGEMMSDAYYRYMRSSRIADMLADELEMRGFTAEDFRGEAIEHRNRAKDIAQYLKGSRNVT